MKLPGTDHPIEIERDVRHARVIFNGRVVARSSRVLVMHEGNYPPVVYVPREDADMKLFERTTRSTYCPYKGNASYFSIMVAGRTSENAVWSYEAPYDAVAAIARHLAFYPSRVDSIEFES